MTYQNRTYSGPTPASRSSWDGEHSMTILRQAMGPGYQVALFREASAIGVQIRPASSIGADVGRPPRTRPRRRFRRALRGVGLRLDWSLPPLATPAPCPSC